MGKNREREWTQPRSTPKGWNKSGILDGPEGSGKGRKKRKNSRRVVSQATPKPGTANGALTRRQSKGPTSSQRPTRRPRVRTLPRVQKRATAAIKSFTVVCYDEIRDV